MNPISRTDLKIEFGSGSCARVVLFFYMAQCSQTKCLKWKQIHQQWVTGIHPAQVMQQDLIIKQMLTIHLNKPLNFIWRYKLVISCYFIGHHFTVYHLQCIIISCIGLWINDCKYFLLFQLNKIHKKSTWYILNIWIKVILIFFCSFDWPIDCQVNSTVKAQESMKDIIKIVHLPSLESIRWTQTTYAVLCQPHHMDTLFSYKSKCI